MVMHMFTKFLNMMLIEKAHLTKHSEYVRWHPTPYLHVCVVHKICKAIAAGGGTASDAAVPFLDGKLLSHTLANNAHDGAYGITQRKAEYYQLLGLDTMHVMLVKALESQLTIVLKKVAQSPELKTTVGNQATEMHTAVC